MRKRNLSVVSVCMSVLMTQVAVSQELEPRRWSHLPVGANFATAGYVYTDADIFLDPALQIDDARAEIHTILFSYMRVLDVFGKSGRVEVTLPYATGRWAGLLQGQPASVRRSGFSDPRFRFVVNLLGSPAQRGTEFRQVDVRTIVGIALEVFAPFGEYQEDKLINLGRNQWVFRPQFGVLHNWNKWAAEITGSAWFYTTNDDFLVDKKRKNEPLYSLQGHLIYTFRLGLWASLSAAYGGGAKSEIDGVELADRTEKWLLAASFGFPLSRLQGVKIAYMRGATNVDTGDDFERFILGYSKMWGGQ